jgi:putative sigma-54 modulation protein
VTLQNTPVHATTHQTSASDEHAPFVRTLHAPLEIRSPGRIVEPQLSAWIHDRLARQLGKFGPQIEKIDVRFGDENGPKGGVDHNCMVHVVLSALAPVVVEMRAQTAREAFDLACGRAERATKRALEKSGFSTKHKRKQRELHGETAMAELAELVAGQDGEVAAPQVADGDAAGQYGSGEGRGHERLIALQEHAEENGHTAKRNVKLNTDGMSYGLEDSTTGKPSRKSTRAGKNRIKPANGLTLRTKSAVHSPQAIARRAAH